MSRRIAITGADGRLGRELVAAFRAAGEDVLPLVRPTFDLVDEGAARRIIAEHPAVVVNAAAWTDVDGCAIDPQRAMRINGEGAGMVARAAAAIGALAVQISTNEVFDGTADRPYRESDEPVPANPYGASKRRGEQLVAEATPEHLIIRTAWLFGPVGASFVTKIQLAADAAAREGAPLRVVADEWGNPTWTPALAALVARVADGSVTGTLHLAGQPPTSRHGWALAILRGRDVIVEPTRSADHVRASTPPRRAVLDLERARRLGLPDIDWRQHINKPSHAEETKV